MSKGIASRNSLKALAHPVQQFLTAWGVRENPADQDARWFVRKSRSSRKPAGQSRAQVLHKHRHRPRHMGRIGADRVDAFGKRTHRHPAR